MTKPTTAKLLEQPVLSINQMARVLKRERRNGKPDQRAVHTLIRDGAIRVLDECLPIQHWTIASSEIQRYVSVGRALP